MEHEFRADLDELESLISRKTRMLVLNSPANPTGGLFTREDIVRIAELALRHDLVVLADEIYGRIVYEGEHVSIASIPGMLERTIILDGFSKTYAMTGWRLGYAVVPDVLLYAFGRVIINSLSGTSPFSQGPAIEALTGPQDEVEAMVTEFEARRNLVVDGLNAIPGIRCLKPHAAFYVFPDISATGLDGAELADRLLHDAGVCVLAGTAFGQVGRGHIRISYANSRENLTEALARIRSVVEPLVAARA
jgi:aspartate/methionine/tyrosine aminotransferase